MRWILNDTFLVVVTTTKEVLFFDALLQVFQIQSKFEEQIGKNLFAQLKTYQSQSLNKFDAINKILGHRNQVNFQGLPIQTNNQFIGVFDRQDPKKNLVDGQDKKIQIFQLCNLM